MSHKNKLLIKRRRFAARVGKKAASAVAERTPVSAIAHKTSARVLSNLKSKLSGPTRRRLQKSRGFALARGVHQASIMPEVKVTLKLQALPMTKLIRRLKQASRRAATCKNLLLALSPGSKFAPPLVAEQIHQLSLCRQAAAEISARNHQTQH